MNKKDIKAILMSMRTRENDAMINKLLGKIDMMDDILLQNAVEQVGGTKGAVRAFLEKKILGKQRDKTEKHIPINDMFFYGISENNIHLHLPVDLHQMISQKGISGTIDTINLYLLDAIDRLKALKDDGYYKFQGKNGIYMISPLLARRERKFLEDLDFSTRIYKKKELNNEEFLKENIEAKLATDVFGKGKQVGVASIKFDTISSKEWQEKKRQAVKNFESKGITLIGKKSVEK